MASRYAQRKANVSHAGARIALALIAWCLGACLSPAGAACDLSDPETGTVATVVDGETLQLSDGRIIRLIGAKAPSVPLGWRGEDPWPLVDEAKEALSRLASGATVELKFGGRRLDRHGHALAQVFVVNGETRLWLQEELVAKGLARVYSFPDNRACVAELLARETERGPSGSACGARLPIASKAQATSTA